VGLNRAELGFIAGGIKHSVKLSIKRRGKFISSTEISNKKTTWEKNLKRFDSKIF
jgi:hypothetical protein